jgi:restriction endonuclease Mrr
MLGSVLLELGYDVQVTPSAKDGGKDIVLRSRQSGQQRVYYIELKHWTTTVPNKPVTEFIEVCAYDGVDGGLFLASSGFQAPVMESIVTIKRSSIFLGKKEKIVTLCQQYDRFQRGIWVPPTDVSSLLFSEDVL